MSKTKVVIGCDPGYSTGAVVVLEAEGNQIIDQFSYGKTQPPKLPENYKGDKQFTTAIVHAQVIARRMADYIEKISMEYEVLVLAVEGFVDQKGKMHLPFRWKPPLVLAYLHEYLMEQKWPYHPPYPYDEHNVWVLGKNFYYINADVMRMQKKDLMMAKAGKIPHLEVLSSDHARSAWAHAKNIKRLI